MSNQKQWVDYKTIKERVGLAMVLDRYGVKLKQSGKSLVSCCPIHKGSNPRQFSVSLEKNAWQCFGDCKAGGNALDLVALMEYQSREPEAIRKAALLLKEWFGVDNPESKKLAREEKQPLTEKSRDQAEVINPPLPFMLKSLDPDCPWFTERGILEETAREFGLGLQAKGSLAGRIAIPIHDHTGQLVAYCGRAITDEQIQDGGKYKLPANFHKSHVLYNFYRLSPGYKLLILVESFISVWWLYQSKIKNTVALMGSELSEEQEKLILDYFAGDPGGVITLFDADEAGQKCARDCVVRLSKSLFVKAVDISEYGRKPHHLKPEDLRILL